MLRVFGTIQPVDIFRDNLDRENVAELSQEELNLITTLWLQDLDEVDFYRKKKGRADQPSDDNTVAFESLARDLENIQISLRDAQLAKSIDAALDSDHAILTQIRVEEEVARRDREFALRIDGQENLSRPASAMSNRSTLIGSDNGTLHRAPSVASGYEKIIIALKKLFFGTEVHRSTQVSGTSRNPFRPPTAQCVVCSENTTRFVRVPCNDPYCFSCLCELFEHATKDESLMPPRCCRKEIPFGLVMPHLSMSVRNTFTRKLEEHNTMNRLYCVRPSCSAFLGSADGDRRTVLCPECRTRVCTSCKKDAHPSFIPCKEDKETAAAVEFCREQGWQRCPGCERMIELSHGCYHMTCLCRTEFCYVCRAQWKNCECPQWDERRLYTEAEDRVRNEMRAAPAPANHLVHPVARPLTADVGEEDWEPLEGDGFVRRLPNARLLTADVDEDHWEPLEGDGFVRRLPNVPTASTSRPALPSDFAARVRDMANHLRENHECKHPGWYTQWGPSQCETCFHRLDRFILRCRSCKMRACVRCRRNRL